MSWLEASGPPFRVRCGLSRSAVQPFSRLAAYTSRAAFYPFAGSFVWPHNSAHTGSFLLVTASFRICPNFSVLLQDLRFSAFSVSFILDFRQRYRDPWEFSSEIIFTQRP